MAKILNRKKDLVCFESSVVTNPPGTVADSGSSG